MKKEQQDYYDKYFDLFAHPGWKQLQEELKEALSIIERTALYSKTDEKDFNFVRGEAFKLKQLINFEEITELSYKRIVEGEKLDQDDADL